MKLLLAFALMASFSAHATSVKTRAPAQNAISAAPPLAPAVPGPNDTVKAMISTNILDLSKGAGNLNLRIPLATNIGMYTNFRTFSTQEKRKRLGDQQVTVDRSQYSFGPSFFLYAPEASKNVIISPGLYFGQEKDLKDVDSQSGFGIQAVALLRPTEKPFAFEVGIQGNNLTNDFKGEAFFGFSYLMR